PPALPDINAGGIARNTATRLRARVYIKPPMEAGDLLTLFWGQRFVAAHTLQAREPDDCVDFRVPSYLLQNGTQCLHYRLFKPGNHPLRSPYLVVQVKLDCPGGSGTHELLQPLLLASRLRREGVCLDTLIDDLPCTLPPYRHMAEGDQITVRWGDLRVDLPALKQHQVGHPLQLNIPLSLIKESGCDPYLELSYCILDRVGNCSQWAPDVVLQVHSEQS
ncbi:MAG: hypothetical protein RR726_40070, partial [Pseudomonas sp.]